MRRRVELLLDGPDECGGVRLLSPEVGRFGGAIARGQVLVTGAAAGHIAALAETLELVVPRGVAGRVATERPSLLRQPVGYGDVLYELDALEAAGLVDEPDEAVTSSDALVFRAPHSGRFWQRPSPQEPAYVAEGDIVSAGDTVGLIEVMKTFARLDYTPAEELPRRARIVRVVASDGDEVTEGDPLFEVEKA